MIFMHNESGGLVELLIKSVTDDVFIEKQTGDKLFRLSELSMHNENELGINILLMSEFYKHFTFIGFI